MNLSLVSVFTTLKPAVFLAALVPFLIAMIMWLLFYTRYDSGKLKKIRDSFKKLADDGEKIKDSNRENISFMDEMVVRMAPSYFLEAWLRMLMQIEKSYKGEFIPEGQSFYDFEAMVTGPGCRNRLDSLWKSFWVLSIVTLVLPVGTAFFIQSKAVWNALALGGILFILLCLGNLVFTMLDQKVFFSTKTEYDRFIGTFNRVLPVAKAEVALLLEATQRNQEAYQAATQKIVEKFDTIVDDTLLPALEDSIETIMHSNLIPALHNIERTLDTNMSRTLELQENGMERMTTAFADRLGETVEKKMSDLAGTIGTVQESMEVLNQGMQEHVRNLTETMGAALDLQKQEMKVISSAFTDSLTNTLDVKMTKLAESIGSVQSRMEELNMDLEQHMTGLNAAMSKNITMQEEQTAKAIQLQNERMTQSMELQEKAMERISSTFSDTLTNTLDTQMSSLAMTISDVRGQMEEFNFNLGNHVAELMETTKNSIELQKEQTANSIALQDERITQMVSAQDARHKQMMDNLEEGQKLMLNNQDERINQLIEQQTTQMTALTVSFTESLTSTLDTNIKGLNQEIGDLQILMGELNEKLFNNIDELSSMMNQQRQVLEGSARMLINSEALQKIAVEETRELQIKAVENSEILNKRVQSMAEIIDKLTEQTMTFSRDAFKFTKETNEAQIRMSEDVKLSQGKLEAAVNETMSQYAKMNNMISDMMDNITERMNEAMTNAGREIAYGIKEVTADNAEAISNLTEQAQNLKNDYETYFSRLENSTYKTLEDMDYQIRGIIARITEDIGTMMKENTNANAEILERYKDNTTDLLQSFDEQARSIGLYAKEINMDITDLSNNLQASVGEFSSKMQEGVRVTLSEFDSGLSELTERIANTVESISDAVEALPEALGRK